MLIQYIGGESNFQTFKAAVLSHYKVSAYPDDADIAIYEIASIDALFKVPKKFIKPTLFYITTQDKAVISRVKEYPINGLLFPPLTADSIAAKLKFIGTAIVRKGEDYESIKIKVLAKAENIPPLPSLALELINLTKSDTSTINDVTNKIKQDQGIAARVVKLINSPFYGVRQEISSIDRATMLLGFKSVKNIAMAISLDTYFQKPFNMFKTTGKAMWSHSFKVASIAQELAKNIEGINEDMLYMAGLMHDIGKVVMVDFLVKEVSSIEDEREQLGFDHAEIGAVILNKWSVAPQVSEAVRTHHMFNAPKYGKIIYYANKIDNEFEYASDTIDEFALLFEIKSPERIKPKIISFVKDFNASL